MSCSSLVSSSAWSLLVVGVRALLALRSWLATCLELQPVKVQDEKPDGGGQVGMRALSIDRCHQLRQPHVASNSDLPEGLPEVVFEADAGLVTGDYDRSLEDPRPPLSGWTRPCPMPSQMLGTSAWSFASNPDQNRLGSRPPTTSGEQIWISHTTTSMSSKNSSSRRQEVLVAAP